MKIGILTYHWVYNFGANLQTLASIGCLRKYGYDPVVINWVPEDLEVIYNRDTKPQMINAFKSFQNVYYPMTDICRNAFDIAKAIKDNAIEGVFIGADTVLMLRTPQFSKRKLKYIQPIQTARFPNPFWGEFLNYIDVPVVLYSVASLSTPYKKLKKQKDEICEYLYRFRDITVRDKDTCNMINYFTDGKIIPLITPDPVFNFNNNVFFSEYEEKTLDKFHLNKKYVLLCLLEDYAPKFQKWSKELEKYVNDTGRTLIELPRQTGNQCLPISHLSTSILNPLEWYIIIKNADAFVGSLMHCAVSCIHNEIPLYSLDYYGTRSFFNRIVDYKTSKTYQIMKDCGLEQYYYNIAGKNKPLPKMDLVISSLENYDKNALHEASIMKQKESEISMKEMLNKLF